MLRNNCSSLNPQTYNVHAKSYPHRGVQGGGGVLTDPPLEFLKCCSILKLNDFAFSGKPLIFSTRSGIFYGSWRCLRSVTSPNMVAILDFIKNQKSGNKNRELIIFLPLTCKITHPQVLLLLLKKVENMHFHSKIA